MRSESWQMRTAAAVLALVVLAGLLAPWLAPFDPLAQPDVFAGRHLAPWSERWAVQEEYRWHLAERVERAGDRVIVEVSGRQKELPAADVLNLTEDGVADRRLFVLGTDRMSRDVLSRLIYGARLSLMIGVLALAISVVIGTAVGGAAALGPRWLDQVLMRFVDGLNTFPWLVLLIVLVAFFPTGGAASLAVLIGCTSWTGIARIVRGEVLSLKERDFVSAARGLGAGHWGIFRDHLLPNVLPLLLVDATLRIGGLILFESTLSFLGLGVQPPRPTWGNMIAESRDYMTTAWWVGLFPGIALVATVISLAVMSDVLRDALDPRHDEQPAA